MTAATAALLALGGAIGAAAGGGQAAPATASGEAVVLRGALTQGGLVAGQVSPGSAATLDGRPLAVAPDGRFILGFDRDAAPRAMLTTVLPSGAIVKRLLTIAPRAWRLSRLPTLARVPVPDAEFMRRRPTELAQIAAARAQVTDADGWRRPLHWPLVGRISTPFGAQRIYADGAAAAFHAGVDIARPAGTVVVAPADGVVVLAAGQPFTLEGNLLMIDHGLGLGSAFLHLSRIEVRVGDHVRQGDPIGRVGMTGRATGPHLHWSLRWGDARLDPVLAAGAMGD